MSVPLFALLAVCVDVSAVMVIGFIQLSSSFINNTFILLWAGGLLRTCLPVLVSFSCPGSPAWMRGSEGMQTAAVHGLVYPVYISSLWACDRPIVELVWGWHTCQGVRWVLTHLNAVPGDILRVCIKLVLYFSSCRVMWCWLLCCCGNGMLPLSSSWSKRRKPSGRICCKGCWDA